MVSPLGDHMVLELPVAPGAAYEIEAAVERLDSSQKDTSDFAFGIVAGEGCAGGL